MKNSTQKLIEAARAAKVTLGFAESCTGGLLSSQLASFAGVSDLFLGSVVSYSYQAKVDLLGVSWEVLKTEGAVSEKVALMMATGARKALGCDWSVAITGIAGPTGGLPGKPVGTVCFAVAGPNFAKTAKMIFQGDRNEVQLQSALFASDFLTKSIQQKGE